MSVAQLLVLQLQLDLAHLQLTGKAPELFPAHPVDIVADTFDTVLRELAQVGGGDFLARHE